MIVPADRLEDDAAVRRRVVSGEHVRHYETERARADGRLIPVSVTASSVRDISLERGCNTASDPALTGQAFLDAVEAFRDAHMSTGGRTKALIARQRGDRAHDIEVTLPGGDVRQLEPGESTLMAASAPTLEVRRTSRAAWWS